jgi:hypothetical protein
MSKWITFQELLERWDIEMPEFVECLKKGLQPYANHSGRQLDCPSSYHLGHSYEELIKTAYRVESEPTSFDRDYKEYVKKLKEFAEKELEIIKKDDPDLASWKWPVKLSDEVLKQLFSYLGDEAKFKRDDVLKFEGEHDLGTSKETDRFPDHKENYFLLHGDYWEIGYKGKETKLRDLERLRYIIHLLDNADKEIYVHDLVKLVKGSSPEVNKDYAKIDNERLEFEEGLSLKDIYIQDITEEERDRLEDRAHHIWNSYQSGIGSSKENEYRKNWEAVKRHFRNEYGIRIYASEKGLQFSQKARLSKDTEKARVNVAQNIMKAIKDIEKKLPALGRHLRKQLDKGAKCIYHVDPDDPITWDIRM